MSTEELGSGPERTPKSSERPAPEQTPERAKYLEALEQAGADETEQQPERAATARKTAEADKSRYRCFIPRGDR